MTSIAIWNIRGLNYPAKQKAIRELIHHNKLAIIGIMESKVKEENIDRISRCSGSSMNVISNLDCHYNGRIMLLWNEDKVEIRVIYKSA